MTADEQEIRALVSTWMTATKNGDVETILSLITDDVVFLMPGQNPMVGKADFAAAMQAQSKPGAPEIDGESDIQEVQVLGDWAFMWSKLKITITPKADNPTMTRAGYTLSILKKQDGKWLLARDANMLSAMP